MTLWRSASLCCSSRSRRAGSRPDGQTRYLAAVYPCFAVLVGVLANRASTVEIVGVMWRRYLLAASILLALVAVAGVVGAWALNGTALARVTLPPGRAAAYAMVLIGIGGGGGATDGTHARRSESSPAQWPLALACAVIHTGALTDSRAAYTNDIEVLVAPVRERVPEDCNGGWPGGSPRGGSLSLAPRSAAAIAVGAASGAVWGRTSASTCTTASVRLCPSNGRRSALSRWIASATASRSARCWWAGGGEF